ncbi:MAG: organic solvent ABC transporter ATP-binding protein [Gammaproteobacteria bacterium]
MQRQSLFAARRTTVLELVELSVSEGSASDAGSGLGRSVRASLQLSGGELALVQCSDAAESALIADACVGLRPPRTGAVRFMGQDWARLGPAACARMRSRIGRVFGRGSWLEHLSVADNILLPSLHHTRTPVAELREQAVALARSFALPGLPSGRPSAHARSDLQRAACVRALMGSPSLIVLEEPIEDVFPEAVAPLVNALRRLRDQGAAVLWFVLDPLVWQDRTIPADRRFRLLGRTLTELGDRR